MPRLGALDCRPMFADQHLHQGLCHFEVATKGNRFPLFEILAFSGGTRQKDYDILLNR
jgi:hypothetical protein